MTQRAFIREEECIGCAKCLAVCPTDAILGAAKFLHTVIEEDCIGCERCLPVCPIDCIALLPMQPHFDPVLLNHTERVSRKNHFQFLANRRKTRLNQREAEQRALFLALKNERGGGMAS